MNTRQTILSVSLAVASQVAIAGPTCTDEPRGKWLSEQQMYEQLNKQGYRDDVKKLHVSKGMCWEIYGHDKEGRKVEIYFHPITGEIVQANVRN